jgi:hypothetical protein
VLWCRVTAGAAMPKTSVDENRQFEPRDHQVWSPRQRSHIAFESDLFGPHYFAHAPFYARPLGADSAHAFRDGLGHWLWSRITNDDIFADVCSNPAIVIMWLLLSMQHFNAKIF